MGIEKENFNQKSPEHESSEKFTPDILIAYVRDHEELPDLKKEELARINEKMTQQEVIKCHITINSFDDKNKRKELLDTWIPKPKVLYHASSSGDIEELEPRGRYKRREDDPDMISGATSPAVAALMLARGKSGSYDSGRTWTFMYPKEDFVDKGGYIYELPPDDFECDPDIGLGLAEWTSKKPITPQGNPAYYASSIQAMLEHGVKVYPVDEETFRNLNNSSQDNLEILKKLTPIE